LEFFENNLGVSLSADPNNMGTPKVPISLIGPRLAIAYY